MEWRIWLARRQPARAVAVIGVLLAVGAWAYLLFHHPLPVLAAAFLLLGAVGEFLLPITYRLSPLGAEARNLLCWRWIDWAEVKRVTIGPAEVKLSPLAHAGSREAFRGVLLRCGADRVEHPPRSNSGSCGGTLLDAVEHPPRSRSGSCGGTLPDREAVLTAVRNFAPHAFPERDVAASRD
jgi:hypothetical protein